MDNATRNRLRAFRSTVLAPAARMAVAEEPPADPRPRFNAGPLKGKLKDRKARLEEALGLDDPEANEWLTEAAQMPEWKTLYEKYETLYGPQGLAEQKVRHETEDMDTTAKHLGIAPEKFRSPEWREKNAGLIVEADRRVKLREQADALAAELDAPLPEEAEAAQP